MRKSQADQRVARKQKERSAPLRTRFPGCGRPSMNSLAGDESPSVGAHIRGRPRSGNPRIPASRTCSHRERRNVPEGSFTPLPNGRNPPLPKEGRVPEFSAEAYFEIFETTPEPTVRPPSRIAKRSPSSMAIGAINLTSIVTLSPGITISVPSGRITSPVTSVVRK